MMGQRRARPNPRNYQPSTTERGGRLSQESLTFIPSTTVLRMLRDCMVVEPMDIVLSRYLVIPPHSSKLVRGVVRAVGPGVYPNQYRDAHGNKNPPKGKRSLLLAGTVFRPTSVKVGDIVHLDGRQTGKEAFELFFWGDRACLHCREEDVAGVEI
jgi:hypothetical protein